MDILKNKIILIADDEPDIREILAFGFRRAGCTVLDAGSGREACALLASKPVDAVICDYRMPDGDGRSVLEFLQSRAGPPPLLLFLSGHIEIKAEDLKEKGLYRILYKPVKLAEIQNAVAEGLAAQRT